MTFFTVQRKEKKDGLKEVISNIGSHCTRAAMKTISSHSSSP